MDRLRHDPTDAAYARTTWNPGLVLHCLAALDIHPASPSDVDIVRGLAAELIGPYVATAETFADIHRKSRASIFVYRQNGEITGTLGIVPLRPQGLDAVIRDTFDARDPARETVCAPGDAFAALYGWGFAARTRKGGAAVVMGSMRLRETVFAQIPCFTRAATPAGERVICTKMGYRPFRGSSSGLLVSPVQSKLADVA